MDDKLIRIISYYGVNAQQRKLQEELFELQEAITCYELNNSVSYEIPICEIAYGFDSITEELADVMVMLCQFKEYYQIDGKEIMEIMEQKIDRQINRIEEEKNERNIQ